MESRVKTRFNAASREGGYFRSHVHGTWSGGFNSGLRTEPEAYRTLRTREKGGITKT